MRVILPISLLFSAVVALMVSRSMLSSRCLLSHYVPTLLLSFVETPACICTGLFTLLIFIPLSPLTILLWIWYFLIPTRSRLSLYIAISLIPSSFIPASRLAPVLPLLFSLQSHSFLSSPSLQCQSSSHSPVFIFCSSLWRASFSPFCFTALLHLVSVRPILHYYFLASFFYFVSSHTVFIVPSQLLQSPRYTPQLVRRDGFSFSACHTCIRRA